MGRVIITTCGTSLLSSSCWEYENLNSLHRSQLEYSDRQQHEIKCYNFLKQAADENIDFSSTFDYESWNNINYLRDLPAELASLKAIQIFFDVSKEPLCNNDKLVLLHPNDNKDDGLFCANILSKVITTKKMLNNINIESWGISGLNPTDPNKFAKALYKIWQESIEQYPEDCGIEYILNLTAGYKATTTLLGAFAYINSSSKIFYLHDETEYKHIMITSFDPNYADKGINAFRTGYFDVVTRKEYPFHISREIE